MISKVTGKVYPSHTPEAKKCASLLGLGWTLELFISTKDSQGNRCAVCRKVLNMDKKQNGARACADHEHSVPPIPRGVICTNCNAGVGQFQDNPDICEAAAVYLRAHQQRVQIKH
jgi:Recombination endonuclease VII